MATFAYDAAKRAARLGKAKQAHDELVAAAWRAQADALAIESAAKRRLADEYDAAQERGEVATQGKPSVREGLPTTADVGLSHKQIHEARMIRAAEAADPGVVERTATALVESGREPTKAAVKRALKNSEANGERGPSFG